MLDRLKDEKILMSLSLTVKVKLTEEVNRGDVIIHHGIKDAPEERGGSGWASASGTLRTGVSRVTGPQPATGWILFKDVNKIL